MPPGHARAAAENLAREIARFPPQCVRADRRSAHGQWDLDLAGALAQEAQGGLPVLQAETSQGAARFVGGLGRGGSFAKL